MPFDRTLRDWIKNFVLTPGICSPLMQLLKLRTEGINSDEKQIILMLDEISFKNVVEYTKYLDLVKGVQDLGKLGATHRACVYD